MQALIASGQKDRAGREPRESRDRAGREPKESRERAGREPGKSRERAGREPGESRREPPGEGPETGGSKLDRKSKELTRDKQRSVYRRRGTREDRGCLRVTTVLHLEALEDRK